MASAGAGGNTTVAIGVLMGSRQLFCLGPPVFCFC